MESAHWMRVARGQELKIVLKSGGQFRFEGFKESDYSNLSEFLSQFYEIKIEDVELSVKGWNWGTAKFKGSSLSFEVDSKPAFEIPLKDVSQATTAGDNEVTLEFHQHDDAQVSLMEMRFYIPTGTDSSDPDPVKTFHKHVLSKADIIQITGDAIVTIPDVACLTPRGRYTMKVFPGFLQLHGKTYDYKIPYTTILRLFLLPHKDQRFTFFVVSMDPPIKQGQTRYPFLITQFEKHEEFDVKLNMSEEEINEKFEGKITQEMSGPIYEIMSRLMKAVVGKKITVPGTFRSKSGASCMTCSFRAGSGLLYPLERGFIFVHKPPIHVRFDEISCVNFARVSGGGGSASRSFDFEVETKSGSVIVFSSIEREEYNKLFDFVNAKKLRIKNTGKHKSSSKDKDDDIFNSDDEQTHDAYLEQVKAEAAERESEDSDETDSDDESFAPDEESDKDVREEFESEPSDSNSDDEEGSDSEADDKKHKKKKEKKEKEKKRKAEKQKSPKKKAKADVSVDSTKRGKGSKKKKDPNAPKRAMSAYMLWLADVRQQIKDENPGISITQLTKLAGEKWKSLGDKSKWEKQAAIAKEKYQEQMKEYKAGLAAAGPSESSSISKKKGTPQKKASKKSDTKSSPRKSVEGQKFKSAEFVDSSGDSSDSDEGGKKKASKPSKKKKEESDDESMEEDASDEEEEMSVGSDSD